MRIERIKPKIAQEIAIGEKLEGFFQEVSELIKQNDELATQPLWKVILVLLLTGGWMLGLFVFFLISLSDL